jgi:hypothetical protein
MIDVMLSKNEYELVRGASEWQDDKNAFKVPLFTF